MTLPDANPSKRPAVEDPRLGYFHVRKEDVHAGSALKVDPPFAAFDVVLRQDYDGLAARVRELEEEIRIREQSQIPVIPRGAQRLIATLEGRVRELESALDDAEERVSALYAAAVEARAALAAETEGSAPAGRVQVACDRCTQGVMDSTNPHINGACKCACHRRVGADGEQEA